MWLEADRRQAGRSAGSGPWLAAAALTVLVDVGSSRMTGTGLTNSCCKKVNQPSTLITTISVAPAPYGWKWQSAWQGGTASSRLRLWSAE